MLVHAYAIDLETPRTFSIIAATMNSPSSIGQISAIVRDLNQACTAINESEIQKEGARRRALSAARELVAELENPTETIFQQILSVRTVQNYLGLIRKASSIVF